MGVLRAEEVTIHPKVSSLFLGQSTVIIRRPHRTHERHAIGPAKMIPLPAAAVERKRPTTMFCTDRTESLGNFCQRGLPVNRVKSTIGAASQRRGQPVGVILIEIEPLRFLTQIPLCTG